MINALSFDIEEWFHLLEIPGVSNVSRWNTMPQIVNRYTDRILEILENFNVRATFFIVGWVAKKNPRLVQKIAAFSHEIASHSYWHLPITQMNRQQFAEDLYRSIDTLQQLTGKKVIGFRAPGFMLTTKVGWAFDVMLNQGLKYDASLIPCRKQHFNCPAAPHYFRVPFSERSIMELPVSVLSLGQLSVPFCGGGYLRLLPQPLLHLLMKRQNQLGLPNVAYLHPRDFAVDCPRIKLPLLRQFRTYHGIQSTQPKLELMLRSFQWDCCAAVLGFMPLNATVEAALCVD